MKYDFVTIGDSFEDVFVLPEEAKIKRDPSFASGVGISFELGDKIPIEEIDYEIGGSACNVAVGLSRLGIKSSLISIVGDDNPAQKIRERLYKEDVDDTNLIVDKSLKSNFSVIFRTDKGRTIFIYRGADYSKLKIKSSLNAKWIYLAPTGDGIEELEKDIIAKISEKNSLFAWNPGSIQIKKGVSHYKNLLKNTSVLFLNKEEAAEFLNVPVKPSMIEVFKRYANLGVKITVITNGKEGAFAYDGKEIYQIPALEHIVRVDSTGAGDSFATGFLGKLFHLNWSPKANNEGIVEEALKWGIINSNNVITYVGAQKGLLNLNEIESKMRVEKLSAISS